ncbi:MAG: TonB-dependent receptor [Bacteroidetes bacterium]|nr:TonB-dependent receptor [Bacteroidota bacterium]
MLFFIQTKAQVITFRDAESGQALGMVYIISNEPSLYTISNSLGQSDLSQFKNSELLEIRRLGYKAEEVTYTELIKRTDFLLTPSLTIKTAVVSATRQVQNEEEIPSRIIRITPEFFRLINPQTTADLLGSSGEVFIQKSQQGGGSPMIRGFATNRLLYSVDGVRMNTAIFRAGNIQNVISLDAFAIENTEILPGPGSVMYGSDAIGAVMSFHTLTPQLSLSKQVLTTGNAAARYSTANSENTFHFDVNNGFKKWALLTSFTHSKFGDLKMGSYGPDDYLKPFYVERADSVDRVVTNKDPEVQNPSGYSQLNFMQKIRYKPNDRLDMSYAFHYSETSNYSRYDRMIEIQTSGLPVSAVWNYGPQKWSMHHLQVDYSKPTVFFDRATLRMALQNFEESRIDRRFNHYRLRTQKEYVAAASAQIDLEKKQGKSTFYYGFEFVQNKVKSRGSAVDIRDNSSIAVPDRYPQSDWVSMAAYLNYEYKLSRIIFLNAGLRYNNFEINSDFTRQLAFYPFDFSASSIKNAATTGCLGININPGKNWRFILKSSTGFRAPNVDDMGKIFDFASGEVVVPNTNLNAEYAYNAELNIVKNIDNKVIIELGGFYTYLDNAMVRRKFQVEGKDSILYDGEMSEVYAIQNASFSEVRGFHAGAEIKLPEGFEAIIKYNYQSGMEEMDDGTVSPARHAAPAFFKAGIGYKNNKLNLQLYLLHCDEVTYSELNEEERQKPVLYARDNNGIPYSPAWTTINLKILFQINYNISVSAGIENMADIRYRPYSSGIAASGRNFVFSIQGKF